MAISPSPWRPLLPYVPSPVSSDSWLHFQGLHALVPSVLQTLCSQLLHVHRARAARAVSVKLASYTLTLTPNAPTVCLASGDFAQLSASPLLPSSTFEVFKTFSMLPSDRKVATEGLLLAHQFKGASRLAGMLEKFWSGAEELFTRNALRPSEARIDLPCGHQVLRRIVALAERHLMEFEQMQGGGDVWEGSDQGSAVPSLQYSDGMRASLRLSLGGTIPHEDVSIPPFPSLPSPCSLAFLCAAEQDIRQQQQTYSGGALPPHGHQGLPPCCSPAQLPVPFGPGEADGGHVPLLPGSPCPAGPRGVPERGAVHQAGCGRGGVHP